MLVDRFEQFMAIAPVVDRGRVYVSTQGFVPGGRGAIYALSAATGRIVWRFQTIKLPWTHPAASGGGGAWNPVSVDEHGNVYAGIANPGPWGGSSAFPNGGVFPGPALYTDSLVVLDGASGRLRWYDQVTPHDVRDHDFQASPILATVDGRRAVFGAGKGGLVVAWDRTASHATLVARRGPPPERSRTAARAAEAGLPGTARGRAHADGVRRRPPVRPGRRALLAGERGHDEERVRAPALAGEGNGLRPRRRHRARPSGRRTSGRRRSGVRRLRATR